MVDGVAEGEEESEVGEEAGDGAKLDATKDEEFGQKEIDEDGASEEFKGVCARRGKFDGASDGEAGGY